MRRGPNKGHRTGEECPHDKLRKGASATLPGALLLLTHASDSSSRLNEKVLSNRVLNRYEAIARMQRGMKVARPERRFSNFSVLRGGRATVGPSDTDDRVSSVRRLKCPQLRR